MLQRGNIYFICFRNQSAFFPFDPVVFMIGYNFIIFINTEIGIDFIFDILVSPEINHTSSNK